MDTILKQFVSSLNWKDCTQRYLLMGSFKDVKHQFHVCSNYPTRTSLLQREKEEAEALCIHVRLKYICNPSTKATLFLETIS